MLDYLIVITKLHLLQQLQTRQSCQAMSINNYKTSSDNSNEITYENTNILQNATENQLAEAANDEVCIYIKPQTKTLSGNTAERSAHLPKIIQTKSSKDVESLKPSRPWRNKGQRKLCRMLCVCLAYTAAILVINCVRTLDGVTLRNDQPDSDSNDDLLIRERRDVVSTEGTLATGETTVCTPRSIENFPGNFMTKKDTKNGGCFIHILIAIYMFAALAVVCDDYFVPALEHICEDLGLQEDVAGATFMAAGSSAPEFMTSVIGVFIANNDVGTGTIVGSAVFNILFIIGVCGLFAGMVVQLTWYPLVRDTSFYLLSVFALFLTIRDKSVTWYEALIMVLLYVAYILIMYFNRPLEKKSKSFVAWVKAKFSKDQPIPYKPADEPIEEQTIPEEMMRARAHSRISLSLSLSYEKREMPTSIAAESTPEEHETSALAANEHSNTPSLELPKGGDHASQSREFESVWKAPNNFFIRCIWVSLVPIRAMFYVSIPDSRRPGIWARLYMLSFVMSVAWLAGLTYVMVWMVTIAGDALDIPDTVMGLTLLAAGTSVPDCLSSVFVARDGYGDMAVSNSIGSNVFDILMCLGLPWLIECAINNGESVQMESAGLTYSTLTLLATVVFLVASMAINKWKLTKIYGVFCLIAYIIATTFACLFELNVFEQINPPTCPD